MKHQRLILGRIIIKMGMWQNLGRQKLTNHSPIRMVLQCNYCKKSRHTKGTCYVGSFRQKLNLLIRIMVTTVQWIGSEENRHMLHTLKKQAKRRMDQMVPRFTDILTKGLSSQIFQIITNKLGMENIHSPAWGGMLTNQPLWPLFNKETMVGIQPLNRKDNGYLLQFKLGSQN